MFNALACSRVKIGVILREAPIINVATKFGRSFRSFLKIDAAFGHPNGKECMVP